MSNPKADEVLFAYIAIASHAVSLVLIRDDNGVQRLVYYVSKSLHEAEVRYLPLEKAILAVVHAMRKLPHYFQAHGHCSNPTSPLIGAPKRGLHGKNRHLECTLGGF